MTKRVVQDSTMLDVSAAPALPTLLDGPSFKVLPKPESKKLMLFFAGTDKKNGRFDFWNVGRQQEANVIFVNGGSNAWYQQGIPGFGASIAESVATIRRWSEALQAPEIYTFGVSMGGYGAVLFGAKLNADVLAFGLDTVLRVAGSRSRKRMPKDTAIEVPDLRPVMAEASARFTIVAGEADTLDLVGATHVDGLANTRVVTLRGVGHGAAPFFETRSGLAKVIHDFSKGLGVPSTGAEGCMSKQPAAVTLLWQASEQERAGELKEAERLARAAQALMPSSEAAQYLLGTLLQKRKQHAEAAELFARVARQVPHFAGAHMQLAACLRALGKREAALQAYRTHLTLKPDSAGSYYWIGQLLRGMGQPAEGLVCLKRAVELQPDHDGFRAGLELALKEAPSDSEPPRDVFAQRLRNDASGSGCGLIWFSPHGLDLSNARAAEVTHVQVIAVDQHKLFQGNTPTLQPGIYPKAELRFDAKRGWWRLSVRVDGAACTSALGKNAVELVLLRDGSA